MNNWHLQAHLYKYNMAVRRWCINAIGQSDNDVVTWGIWLLEVRKCTSLTKEQHTSYVRYVTQKTYLFLQTHRVGFPKVAARQYADARAAMRGSSAQQCADLEEVCVHTRWKMGIGCWSSILNCSHATEGLSPLVSHFFIHTPLRI